MVTEEIESFGERENHFIHFCSCSLLQICECRDQIKTIRVRPGKDATNGIRVLCAQSIVRAPLGYTYGNHCRACDSWHLQRSEQDICLDSGKNVVPNGGLKFEEVGSHVQDCSELHWIGETVTSEKVVSVHRIAPWILQKLVLLSDSATKNLDLKALYIPRFAASHIEWNDHHAPCKFNMLRA
jgi:hypothetical protein